MAVTQKDIARLAGVSQAVVSDVLHGGDRARVRPETRRRVQDAAEQLQYRPNAAARALRTNRSNQVAYVAARPAPNSPHAIGDGIVGHAAEYLSSRGCRLLIDAVEDAEGEVETLLKHFGQRSCDGALLRVVDTDERNWNLLREMGAPVVVIGHCPDPGLTSVAHDASQMVLSGLTQLCQAGHRSIGFLYEPSRGDYLRITLRAWSTACQSLRLVTPERIARVDSRQEATRLAARWFTAEACPASALVCFGMGAGVGATRAAMALGLVIGTDIDLLVVSSASSAWLFEPGTWFYGTDPTVIGERSAAELLRRLDGEGPDGPIRVLPELRRLG